METLEQFFGSFVAFWEAIQAWQWLLFIISLIGGALYILGKKNPPFAEFLTLSGSIASVIALALATYSIIFPMETRDFLRDRFLGDSVTEYLSSLLEITPTVDTEPLLVLEKQVNTALANALSVVDELINITSKQEELVETGQTLDIQLTQLKADLEALPPIDQSGSITDALEERSWLHFAWNVSTINNSEQSLVLMKQGLTLWLLDNWYAELLFGRSQYLASVENILVPLRLTTFDINILYEPCSCNWLLGAGGGVVVLEDQDRLALSLTLFRVGYMLNGSTASFGFGIIL